MNTLFGIGIVLIAGFIVGKIIEKLKVPSVAGYIIAGLVLGKSFLGIIDSSFIENSSVISDVALGIIAFSIGGELVVSKLKEIGIRVFFIAAAEAFFAFLLVFLGMLLMKLPVATALLLGSVAAATAPAATVMVLNEMRCKGPLTTTLIAVVAIDDVVCLIIYAIASSVAKVLVEHGESIHISKILLGPAIEIGGSLVLGIAIGAVVVFMLRLFGKTHEMLVILIGALFVTIGLANMLELSTLLTSMAVGMIVANFSSRRMKAFMVVESITAPIYVAFFVLAGSRLDIHMLWDIGLIGLVYTVARMLGKIGGASFMASVTKAHVSVRKYIGFGLISQIGVAVGLAIIISHEFAGTGIGELVIMVLLATTIITEIIGPLMTKFAVTKSGEAYQLAAAEEE